MKLKRVISIVMLAVMSISLFSCNESGGEEVEKDLGKTYLESNYVYMWHKDGLLGEENRMMFQTEEYDMLVDSRSGKIVGFDVAGEEFVERDIETLNAVEMSLQLKVGDNFVETSDIPLAGRIIDSGRYVNRWDNISLRFKGCASRFLGRTEYVATKNYMAFNYQVFTAENGNYDMQFIYNLAKYTLTKISDGRGVKALDGKGNGFIFLKQTAEDSVEFEIDGTSLKVAKQSVAIPKEEYTGYGIIIIPVKNNDEENLEKFLANEKLTITAKTDRGEDLPVKYNSAEGIHYIDITSITTPSQTSASGRTSYDVAEFEVENQTAVKAEPNICFNKTSALSITGLSPMLRDFDTKEPTGEQVQISKDWHKFGSDAPVGDKNSKLWEGVWFHGYTSISVNANKTEEREYLCAYGQWGSLYSASHSQLCLIGWGGNQLWDQSAMGSWGESVTYDPDVGLNRSMIDDVRPFLVKAPTGGNQEYNWSGNVGGADFLNYIEDSEQRIINQKITYITQAPNVTNVNYSGVTQNGKIKTDITINMGRTDDVVRNYYTIRYTFLENVEFGRLSLFKVCADGYADNRFEKYAYGDVDNVTVKDASSYSAKMGYDNGDTKNVENDNFWFGLYNSSDVEEGGDVMMTVRSFNAKLNGKTYTKPAYNLFGTSNGTTQMSCEITVPTKAGNKIKKGSTIELVVEYTILPDSAETYYGKADYLNQTKNIMGTADAMYQQAVGGQIITNATVGKITSSYPVRIEATKGEVLAQFTLNGGLGYVPVMIDGLESYKGYKLQVNDGGTWKDIDQSVKGNDFWQAYRNTETGMYQLSFNVKNTTGLNYNVTNEYRLIKK